MSKQRTVAILDGEPPNLLPTEIVHRLLNEQMSANIERMESEMLEHAQVDIPVTHRFINGMYAREIIIPADTLLTGRVHKNPYVDIMLSGDIEVATPDGIRRLQGTHILEGLPGRKRAGYAYQDTRWITVHRTNETDPDKMIDHLTYFSMAQYNAAMQCLKQEKDEEELLCLLLPPR